MNFDFSALLVLLTIASGLIWLLDAFFFSRDADAQQPLLVEYARSFFPVFLIVLILRSFLFEPFRIPSDSMTPTLLHGDFILVNKYNYGIRLPVLNTKIITLGAPARGDIVVFRYPEEPSIPYIKRVVGVPGDHLVYKDKKLTINGEPMPLSPVGIYKTAGIARKNNGLHEYKEQLDSLAHSILIHPRAGTKDVETVIPDGNYFVLGDNRDNSKDSRYWGLVPDANLVGRAFYIWMNWSSEGFFKFGSWDVEWDRVGSTVI
ncbi:MAG: signal peptidase I [Gammaproteobacteria bacterium]